MVNTRGGGGAVQHLSVKKPALSLSFREKTKRQTGSRGREEGATVTMKILEYPRSSRGSFANADHFTSVVFSKQASYA